ncbi:MAG: thioredoxin family protein [Sulfuricurvum sp.]|jgi:thioredoxin-like negative regulator of GroEL|uniref:thioredoxin family protein n=1 Tax=Sulfuricurvum sp. TaxID=2025608 RepID=UPI0025E8F690|nr:thioredoxin family protein [Sulfuricurvum sp.]MCK9372146.1 thioredoxin family protein [Sulfuricurvum sp.]
MIKYLSLIALCGSLFAAELQPRPYALVKQEIGKGQVVMVEAGSTMCSACKEMGELLYSEMKINPKRKIFFVNVAEERDAARAMKIQMIPTQIVYDPQGREIDRHIGGFTTDALKQFLAKHKI